MDTDAVRAGVLGCLHCGDPVDLRFKAFCCAGCETVYGVLNRNGLSRYYDLRRRPVSASPVSHSRNAWIEVLQARRQEQDGPLHATFEVRGVHCAACVWLIEELFRRSSSSEVSRISVNPALGRIEIWIPRSFEFERWVVSLRDVGYDIAPSLPVDHGASDGLLLRAAICFVLASNTMLLTIATYLGLNEGVLFEKFQTLSFAAGTICVFIGAPAFIRTAWRGLRAGVLHLDLPISIGICLAFVGSCWSYFTSNSDAFFIDTLAVFITLMLFGRWVQSRLIERHRHLLLQDHGIDGMLVRKSLGTTPELVPASEIYEGDELWIASRELVPVRCKVLSENASCSLDWINGESDPIAYRAGDIVEAGAFNASEEIVRMRAMQTIAASSITSLLSQSVPNDEPQVDRWWQRVSKYYSLGVLGASAIGVGFWAILGDFTMAFQVGTAVLIVTCPCAFGIAVPLAFEIASAKLRQKGLYVCNQRLFLNASRVNRVVFDKTGTLTWGALQLRDNSAIRTLPTVDREVLRAMVARSAHPKSNAVSSSFKSVPQDLSLSSEIRDTLIVNELPALGLTASFRGAQYRLGAPVWAGVPNESAADLVFARNGELLASLQTEEVLRPNVGEELTQLQQQGVCVSVVSGDRSDRAEAVARQLSLDTASVFAEQSPQDKANFVVASGPNTLFFGDGINDSLAAKVASCSGTPAIDRPFMAARSDFFVMSAGLSPIRHLLRISKRVSKIVKADLAFAVVYNIAVVALAWSGHMQPWLAAVLMPLSSVVTVSFTSLALHGEDTAWT
ncbi:MAG: heavy metal translocating P-type ATPase metal-binding domain-containing protein [Polyangiales bacterium]